MKRITTTAATEVGGRFSMSKYRHYVGCDDGSTYLFERADDDRLWRLVRRYDADGGVSVTPHRVPTLVALHMDGRTLLDDTWWST
jgi:hypothetical protein